LQPITLGFGGKALQIETDIDEVAEFVTSSHRAMIASSVAEADRTMRIVRGAGGFWLDAFFFDGEDSASFLLDLIRLRIVTAFIELRPDLIWIHSGVVSFASRGLLIVAPSGQGKSTLVTYLCERGWQFLSDEMAPIDARSGTVLPYPRTPVRRVDPGHHVDRDGTVDLEKVAYEVPVELQGTQSVAIQAIVFPVFSHGGATVVEDISSGEAALELMSSCTNFPDHKGEAFTALAHLGAAVPCRRVSYGDGNDAANVLHGLKEGLFIFP
jgi:hypothetical protein